MALQSDMADRPHSPAAPPSSSPTSAGTSPYKSTGGLQRIVNATRYSLRGLTHAYRHESAFRQELVLTAVLIPVALLLPLAGIERVALIATLMLVLIVELLNSAVEAVVDRVSLEYHNLSGRAKDLGSAAVMLALLLCGITWLAIAGPALLALF